MENEKCDSDAAARHGPEGPETASKKSGLIQANSRSLAEPAPSIKTLDAPAEVQSTAPPPPLHESVREAGMPRYIFRIDGQSCGGITR